MGTLASGSIDLKSLKVAGEGATSYITAIDNNGIKVHAANNIDLNYTQITSDGMEVFKTDGAESNPSAVSIANFGEIVRIGKQDETYIKMDYHSLQLVDKEQNSYFHISDLRKWENIEGNNIFVATLTENFILDNSQNRNRIRLQNPIYQIVEVTINDVITTEVHFSGYILYIDTSVAAEDKIQVIYKTLSDKTKAFTFGSRVTSSQIGIYSIAMGYNITANGPYSYAEGKDTIASGNTSHAEGNNTTASGNFSHAEGWGTIANGTSSHAEGYQTVANQLYSHVEGSDTVASGIGSHAEGDNTIASGTNSHAEGQYTEASANNSHAEGYSTTANANHSHAEGNNTTASANNSHAEGYSTTASANNSHAEGNSTTAGGYGSHAEGNSTTASGSHSHAEGDNTIASGIGSHAEGDDTTASGIDSHAGGRGTIAQGYCQTVIGHYNIPQSSSPVVNTDHAFIIGNGTDSNTRSNALTVDWSGNLELTGSLKTNRDVLSDSKTISITATGQTLNFCSLTLPANSKFLILTTVYTNRGTNLTLINHITCTNNATMVGANTRVTTSSGQGLANWYYVVTNDSSSVATLHGYSYPDGGTGYNQVGSMVAIPL